jgi:serine/threonine-protein kinase
VEQAPGPDEFESLFVSQGAAPAPAEEPRTVLFSTAPEPHAAIAPAAPQPTAEISHAEHTVVFAVPPGETEDAAVCPAEAIVPDVSLTITASSDSAYVGREARIERFPFRIGRGDVDLRLPFDSALSAAHAEIDYRNGGFTIRDLHSRNGTFVGGRRLAANRPEPLLFGARILLGSNTQLTFGSNELAEIPDLTGTVIHSRYTLNQKLHSSAKSVVYAASDCRLPRPVAIKILSPKLVCHPGYREQFTQEAIAAARLRHPNILRVLDHGETQLESGGRALYVCMDYLEGGSLTSRIARQERFATERVVLWVERICEALAYVHEQEVVHGGIKPSAILFDSHQNPYLTDFAAANSPSEGGHRAIVGGPGYLAPEQWDSARVTPATDQYSLAVVIYTVLTGALPHEGQEHPEVRKRNYLRGPLPAHEMAAANERPPFPPAISDVLKRAMAFDPAERFGSVREFAAALREALTGGRVERPQRRRIFISYHRASSSPWALLLKKELEREHGLEVFVDAEQRDNAGNFPKKLERNIAKSDVFICLLAEPTLESAWVRKEIEVAFENKKPMIPVFQESFRHPRELNELEPAVQELLVSDGIKFLDLQNIYIEAALKSLSDCIRHCVAG